MPIKLKKWFTYAILKPIKDLFNKIPIELKQALHAGIVIAEGLNKFIDSGVADVLVKIIPGEWDDKLKDKIKEGLPKILIDLKLAEACANESDPNKIVLCAINTIQEATNGNVKSAWLHSLSILIGDLVSDGDLSWKDGAKIGEWYFEHLDKPIPTSLPQ